MISAWTEFHVTADLTMNELLESDFSTTGTLKLPWAALLVLVGLRLVSIYTGHLLALTLHTCKAVWKKTSCFILSQLHWSRSNLVGVNQLCLVTHLAALFCMTWTDYVLCPSPHRDHVSDDGHEAGVGHNQSGLKAGINSKPLQTQEFLCFHWINCNCASIDTDSQLEILVLPSPTSVSCHH